MKAMILDGAGQALRSVELPEPSPGRGEVLLDVRCCGVCRTDLHVLDGELDGAKHPLILGHELVGTVIALGAAT